jgi:N-methylhydantoinase A
MLVVGADVGGTFTDIVAVDPADGAIVTAFKLPTTPGNPADAILAGLDRLGPVARLLHGATVGTNALIQKRGARTGLVTTKGFRDVLELRRQARPRL